MIDWSSAFWAGVAGGVAMEISAIALRMIGLSRMSMVNYEGCMLTRRNSGVLSYLAGMAMHLTLSVLIAFAYAWAFEAIWHGASWLCGLTLAVPHWTIGGMVVPLMDRISGCVKRGVVQPLKLFATESGAAFLIFLVGHLTYGTVVGLLYNVQG